MTGGVRLPIQSNTWKPQPDWIDISNVANNEIHLLAADVGIRAVAFSVTATGGYNVDWGDGTQDLGVASGAKAEHVYTLGAGQSCSLGYTTFKIRIWATNTITQFLIQNHTSYKSKNYSPILWAVFGTTGLTTLANVFYKDTGTVTNCTILESVYLPTSLDSCTSLSNAFNSVFSLRYIRYPNSMNAVTTMQNAHSQNVSIIDLKLPTSMSSCTNFSYLINASSGIKSLKLPTTVGNVTTLRNMAQSCVALEALELPTTMNSVTDIQSMCSSCWSLVYVQMPTSMTALTTTTAAFNSCYSLRSITLPNMTSVTVLNAATMFQNCYSLREIVNMENLGSTGQYTNTFDMTGCEELRSATFRMAGRIFINGTASVPLKLETMRYTNTVVTSSSTSPAFNISYTNLSAAALNQFFTDLPVAATTKNIIITGATGANTCDTTIATAKNYTVTN